jgi:hypothetical protein
MIKIKINNLFFKNISYYNIKNMKYHFEFVIPNATNKVDLTFPTAPMYIEGDTYSGRCKLWLKYASMPTVDAGALLTEIGNRTASLEFKTPAINRFNLVVDGGAAAQAYLNNTQTNARFVLPVNNKTLVYDNYDVEFKVTGAIVDTDRTGANLGAYPFYQSVDVSGGGVITTRKTLDLVQRTNAAGGTGGSIDALAGTQETQFVSLAPVSTLPNNNAVGQIIAGITNDGNVADNRKDNLHFFDGRPGIFGNDNLAVKIEQTLNRSQDGERRGIALCYDNENMDDSNCLIIGSPWGNRIEANITANSLGVGLPQNRIALNIAGAARFEIVIEPMTNDDPVEVGI